jgi:hypothetical protein
LVFILYVMDLAYVVFCVLVEIELNLE